MEFVRRNMLLLRSTTILKCILITVLTTCMLTALPISSYAEDDRVKKVLVLNSYHPGFAWSDGIMGGVKSEFKESERNIKIDIEYMDTKRISDLKHYNNLYRLYKYGSSPD